MHAIYIKRKLVFSFQCFFRFSSFWTDNLKFSRYFPRNNFNSIGKPKRKNKNNIKNWELNQQTTNFGWHNSKNAAPSKENCNDNTDVQENIRCIATWPKKKKKCFDLYK